MRSRGMPYVPRCVVGDGAKRDVLQVNRAGDVLRRSGRESHCVATSIVTKRVERGGSGQGYVSGGTECYGGGALAERAIGECPGAADDNLGAVGDELSFRQGYLFRDGESRVVGQGYRGAVDNKAARFCPRGQKKCSKPEQGQENELLYVVRRLTHLSSARHHHNRSRSAGAAGGHHASE